MKITGILPALVTPLEGDRKTVDQAATRRLIEYQLSLGADGFYILGSTGEGLLLEEKERMKMCEIAVDAVRGRKPVICHIAAMNFDEAIRLAKHAEKAGVTAVSAIPPIFFHYSEKDVYYYYKLLATATHLPFIMYNHSAVNGGLSAAQVAKIFEIDNVTGVKWTLSNYFELMKLKDLTHGEMNIINGPDETLVQGLAAGCDAGIGTSYNVMLPKYLEIYRRFTSGDIAGAAELQREVNKVIEVLLANELIPATKHLCKMLGFDVGSAARPLREYTSSEAAALEAAIRSCGWEA